MTFLSSTLNLINCSQLTPWGCSQASGRRKRRRRSRDVALAGFWDSFPRFFSQKEFDPAQPLQGHFFGHHFQCWALPAPPGASRASGWGAGIWGILGSSSTLGSQGREKLPGQIPAPGVLFRIVPALGSSRTPPPPLLSLNQLCSPAREKLFILGSFPPCLGLIFED